MGQSTKHTTEREKKNQKQKEIKEEKKVCQQIYAGI